MNVKGNSTKYFPGLIFQCISELWIRDLVGYSVMYNYNIYNIIIIRLHRLHN